MNQWINPSGTSRAYGDGGAPDGRDTMPQLDYLIIGGGMAADAAARGIRELDTKGAVALVTQEDAPPYKRPPLTKGLWKGDSLDSIWLGTDKSSIQLTRGRRIVRIDPGGHRALDDQGNSYDYKKALLATGGTPRRLGFGGDDVIYFRSVADYEKLRRLAGSVRKFVVIGGGFIGSEIAAALAMNGRNVTMIFPDPDVGARIFPQGLAGFVTRYYRDKGITVAAGDAVTGLERRGERFAVETREHGEVEADTVVAGLGITPNVDLAREAGVRVEDGVVVDEHLRTSAPDLYAAGDAAFFFNPALGKRLRVEHEDNAVTMGRAAGRSMAGSPEPYRHLPFFYSDLFELGYEAVGETDARLEMFEDWKEPFREGVVYYLARGRVRGVLLWNVWNQVDAARALIAEPGPLDSKSLKGRLPA
ncbi:MAG TPA: FAD/NAD(P)-binding oxidoreductase [Thermoanaerobaculia bacterium]|nr:FAD/NAD(P)-binding oxidoreductase [Thermoanaerobaculia bacterium]